MLFDYTEYRNVGISHKILWSQYQYSFIYAGKGVSCCRYFQLIFTRYKRCNAAFVGIKSHWYGITVYCTAKNILRWKLFLHGLTALYSFICSQIWMEHASWGWTCASQSKASTSSVSHFSNVVYIQFPLSFVPCPIIKSMLLFLTHLRRDWRIQILFPRKTKTNEHQNCYWNLLETLESICF